MLYINSRTAITMMLSLFVTSSLVFGDSIPAGRFVAPQPIPGIEFDSRNRFEAMPVIGKHSLEMFFVSSNNGRGTDIYRATRASVDAPFDEPQVVSELSTSSNEMGSGLSADGLSLYFHSDRNGQYDVYRATRPTIGEPFDQILRLPTVVNTGGVEGGATVTGDGETIFFHRRSSAGTARDIYMFVDEDGIEGPISLDHVNDGHSNGWPSVSSDGRFVFFSDFDDLGPNDLRPDGFGSEDLWVTFRESADEPFVEPVNVNDLWPESEVNSAARDVTPYISPDWPIAGSQLYWTTNFRGDEDLMFATWMPTLSGDFNSNENLDAADIDLLTAEIFSGLNRTAFDLNNDRAVDLFDQSVWIHNIKNTWFGDANLDGEFNSSDFVQVFQAGKYETEQMASWSEGDWNADQRFDSSDFVAAFQNGGYEMGPREVIASVPEPSSCLMLILGGVAFGPIRQRSVKWVRRSLGS